MSELKLKHEINELFHKNKRVEYLLETMQRRMTEVVWPNLEAKGIDVDDAALCAGLDNITHLITEALNT